MLLAVSRYGLRHQSPQTSRSKDLGLAGERIGDVTISPSAAGRELLARELSHCTRVPGFAFSRACGARSGR